jgi:hypothetical protein
VFLIEVREREIFARFSNDGGAGLRRQRPGGRQDYDWGPRGSIAPPFNAPTDHSAQIVNGVTPSP